MENRKIKSKDIIIDDCVMTVGQAAEFMGIRRDTLYKRMKNGISPPYHVSGKVRKYFLKSEIIEYVKNS